jgi:hypothetical protein
VIDMKTVPAQLPRERSAIAIPYRPLPSALLVGDQFEELQLRPQP